MSYYGNKFSQKEHEVLKKAAEARKQGKVLSEYDEKGQLINPYIPLYIAKAPWYMNTGEASLEHQRTAEKQTDSSVRHVRGVAEADGAAKRYRKGACENCGATTHKVQDCLDRPRKRGARWTSLDIRPDEFVQDAELDFDAKRDRWAGYDVEEYAQVIEDWERVEAERRAAKAAAGGGRDGGEARHESGGSEESEGASEGEEKYTETVDMPGQKVDMKTRMTVRNLRLREDTAKYLRNLDLDSAHYDPKTRSMREPERDAEEGGFVAASEAVEVRFAWQSASGASSAAIAAEKRPPRRTRAVPVERSIAERYAPLPAADAAARVEEVHEDT